MNILKLKIFASVLALILCISATVGLRIASDNAVIPYEEVNVTVVHSEVKRKKMLKSWQMVYDIVVEYQGQDYQLKNAHNTSSFPLGKEVTVFLVGDKMYANIEGIKSGTPLQTAYIVFLYISLIMLVVALAVVLQARRDAQNAKNE